MSATSAPLASRESQPVIVDFDINVVMNAVGQSTINVSTTILSNIIAGMKEGLNVKGIAEKHTFLHLESDLNACDQITQLIYQKLFHASFLHIQEHSTAVLMPIFTAMNVATGNPESSARFLGSFVFTETNKLIEVLETNAPGSLKNHKIWE